jgi:hypothetical protein
MTMPPAPPANSNVIGLTYDLGPDGASFDPLITLTFNYDSTKVPAGVNEKDLVLAYYDKATGQWVALTNIVVDPVTHTISGKTGHFTAFLVLAYTRPAAFAVSALTLSPTEVKPGESVSIAVTVTNTGDLSGTYDVTLKINNVAMETKKVTLSGQSSQKLTFTTTRDAAGSYSVDVNGLTSTFVVRAPAAFTISALAIPPAEVNIGEDITISALVTNSGDLTGTYEVTLKIDNVVVATESITLAGGASEKVTFTTSKDVAATYAVNLNGLSGTFVVKAGLNWWLIAGIVAGVVAIGVAVYIVRRRNIGA